MAAGDAGFTEIFDCTQTPKHVPVDARPSPMNVSYARSPGM